MSRWLILEDGTSFQGIPFGSASPGYGEIVFTTSMTGYVETITDPSYRGQIVIFASPTVGNYPLWKGKMQSSFPSVSGIVTRDAHAIMHSDPEWIEFQNLLSKNGKIWSGNNHISNNSRRFQEGGCHEDDGSP